MQSNVEELTHGWANGDEAATDRLVEQARACLCDSRTAAPTDEALRALFNRVPRFVVADDTVFEHLVRAMLSSADEVDDGMQGPDERTGEPVVLDLRGRHPPASSSRSDAVWRAWVRLALLLLPGDDQRRLRTFWADGRAADASMRELVRRHMLVMTHLESGRVSAALGVAQGPRDGWGATTRWSVVRGATDPRGSVMRQSWQRLVERYRQPILVAVRRRLAGAVDAEEAAEDFIAYLFEHRVLAKADPHGGRFRAYLQAVLRRYLLARCKRERRSPDRLDDAMLPTAEDDAVSELEEREWAEHVLQLALGRLRARMPRACEILTLRYGLGHAGATDDAAEAISREALATRFAMTLGAIDQTCSRARQVLRECLRQELRDTVDTTADVDAEQRWLEAMLAGRPDVAMLR